MRLHRFYITEQVADKKELTIKSEELVSQVRKVFRLKTKDSMVVFDGSGYDYECEIRDFTEDSISLNVMSAAKSRFMPTKDITLCAAVVKKDNFEWIVEKATELGVTKIIPIMAERSEKKSLNEKRLIKISTEASEQSGRGSVPIIHPIITLKEALGWVNANKIEAVAFHTEGETLARVGLDNLGEGRPRQVIEVFIGPEGGWSPDELDMFHSYKIPVVCLGSQVLRAETAVIAALSQLVF